LRWSTSSSRSWPCESWRDYRNKVRHRRREDPESIRKEDIAAVKASGLSEDQIFELVVCAAIGQATRQYDTAFAALDTATERNDYASRNPR
jgi:hypothetical protein